MLPLAFIFGLLALAPIIVLLPHLFGQGYVKFGVHTSVLVSCGGFPGSVGPGGLKVIHRSLAMDVSFPLKIVVIVLCVEWFCIVSRGIGGLRSNSVGVHVLHAGIDSNGYLPILRTLLVPSIPSIGMNTWILQYPLILFRGHGIPKQLVGTRGGMMQRRFNRAGGVIPIQPHVSHGVRRVFFKEFDSGGLCASGEGPSEFGGVRVVGEWYACCVGGVGTTVVVPRAGFRGSTCAGSRWGGGCCGGGMVHQLHLLRRGKDPLVAFEITRVIGFDRAILTPPRDRNVPCH
mmetsp:Transcript_63885/g.74822  ORF Transcript_63885/g.74822 Transcript_63885/m.74822 type:complete len:288 (+) Transcript_63885:147-1010(+)